MKEPTQEQIKEFWEWYGFVDTFEGDTGAYYWKAPNGDAGIDLPPIDLNNLFKYAMPKLTDKYGGVLFVLPQADIPSWECKILNKPHDEATFGHSVEDPALALFWALKTLVDLEVAKTELKDLKTVVDKQQELYDLIKTTSKEG